ACSARPLEQVVGRLPLNVWPPTPKVLHKTLPPLRLPDPHPRPLDWNGPETRLFTGFHDEDLQRPIIELFEGVALADRGRVAVREANTALTFGELWDAVSGLAGTLAADTGPADLIAILLPACPMFPVAMLACLAAGRPFVVLDPHHPPDWLAAVLREARPALIVMPDERRGSVEARMPAVRV